MTSLGEDVNADSDKYLLVDAATSLIQILYISDKKVVSYKSEVGNSVDLVTVLVKGLIEENSLTIDDFSGMLFCSGPGSSMGLRVALTSINVWKIFSKRKLDILEYCSLEMCMNLNPQFDTIVSYGDMGSAVIMRRSSKTVMIDENFDKKNYQNVALLNTRHVISKNFQDIELAKYDIASANFPILSICRPANGSLKEFATDNTRL